MTDATQLPGEELYISNATALVEFTEKWCAHCQRDKSMREGEPVDECDETELCEILCRAGMAPVEEWRRLESGELICTEFVPVGDPVPVKPERCAHTIDMFDSWPKCEVTK